MKQSIGSGRGSVYNIIMKALQSGDKYGYEICQEIEQKTNGNYILKQPSLYSGLKRLEAQKLVESYWGDSDIGGRRHYYRLTEQGKRKIEQTNFSWEDERNDLVDSMFQKSEIEKNIDDIKADLSKAQSSLSDAQNTNDELNQAINSPAPSSENKTFGHKVNQNQYDLFSFADLTKNTQQSESQIQETNSENAQQSQIEKESQVEQPKLEQQSEKEEEILVTENTSPLEASENSQSTAQNKAQDSELTLNTSKEIAGEKLSGTINFESFMNDSQTSFYQTKEEKTSTPVSIEDLEKSSNFMGSFNSSKTHEQPVIHDNFDELYAQFQKSFEEEKTAELDTKNDFQNNIEEQKRLEQERRMSEALSGNFDSAISQNLHQVEIQKEEIKDSILTDKNDSEPSLNQQSTLRQVDNKNTNLQEDLGFTKDFVDEFNNINFKSIFGDVYDDSDKQNQFDFKQNEQQQETEIVRKNTQPVNDFSDNINLSLDSSKFSSTKAYNPEENSNYKTFEQNYYGKVNVESNIPTSQNLNYNQENAFSTNQNMSFDQKCASTGYNYNDYDIRYLRKNVPEIKTSKFTRIGKLNFTSAMLLSFVAVALMLILTFVSNSSFISTNNQKLFMFADLSIVGLFVIIQSFKYSSSKTKRIVYKFETKRLLINIVVSLVLFMIVFVINNFSGMTIHNIKNYCFSFIVPCCLLVLYIFLPIFNKIFSKLPYYAK